MNASRSCCIFELDKSGILSPRGDFKPSDRLKLASLKAQWGEGHPTLFIKCSNLQSMPKNCEGSIIALRSKIEKQGTQGHFWKLCIVLHMDFQHTHVAFCVQGDNNPSLSFIDPRKLNSNDIYIDYLNQVSGEAMKLDSVHQMIFFACQH